MPFFSNHILRIEASNSNSVLRRPFGRLLLTAQYHRFAAPNGAANLIACLRGMRSPSALTRLRAFRTERGSHGFAAVRRAPRLALASLGRALLTQRREPIPCRPRGAPRPAQMAGIPKGDPRRESIEISRCLRRQRRERIDRPQHQKLARISTQFGRDPASLTKPLARDVGRCAKAPRQRPLGPFP